jgi:hypothetical protein
MTESSILIGPFIFIYSKDTRITFIWPPESPRYGMVAVDALTMAIPNERQRRS